MGDGPDRLWGVTWRVPDITRAQARLQAAGVNVSDVRTGRQPGTQVCTVRSHAAGVPTLLIVRPLKSQPSAAGTPPAPAR